MWVALLSEDWLDFSTYVRGSRDGLAGVEEVSNVWYGSFDYLIH